MVIASMLSEELCSRTAGSLARNLELQKNLLRLVWPSKVECFFSVGTRAAPLSPALIHLDLALVGNLQATSILALGVVNVNHQVGHLTG